MRLFKRKPKLSVVVVFYNMQREAVRTLYSLTVAFQRNISEQDYEVIVLDSNSSQPIEKTWVEGLQSNFRYHFVESDAPTPCRALNCGIEQARADTVVCLIDGARILSPGILHYMQRAEQAFEKPFTYTIGMHLGLKRQSESVSEGYNQEVEDEMLEASGWQENGYDLFTISCLAGSSKEGFLFPIYESNCFAVNKALLEEVGGFDERFVTKGGGLVNLDVFRKLMSHPVTTPVMLIGEATFHQFHGGVSTNVPVADSPWDLYNAEYKEITGESFQFTGYPKQPIFFGQLNVKSRKFFYSERELPLSAP